ncbi:MAG: hypothetical protein JNN24_03530 [Hyphomicrobium zavarzinii]|uniref:hypothetical protein n=1 Tax=Hyphomicrobium zavarzinii TaxID=48292 RepID=UPI001A3703E5|nr:hypothetical protein [Hyphomicrobium zavarzinii]MBL8844822.1 hypothetical protein [Hyphomicrobium zavarzinii]
MGIPWGFDGEHGTDVRPPHVAATKAWAKNESQPGANDGTRVTAALVNRVVGNVRALADAAGSPLTESSDDDILHAVVALIGATAPAPHMHDTRYYQKAETDALLDVKVPISAIVDNLASTSALVPLSAAQGKVLKDLIDGLGDITPVADLAEAATLTGLDRGDLVHVGDNGAGKWARYQVTAVGDGTWAGCTKVLLWTQDQAPATHGHVAGDITDTTADGRAVVTAANFAAIRALLGTAAPCATRSVLKALDPAKFTAAQLLDGGRAGAFEWRTGDFSALVAADTSEGCYIAHATIPATTGCWARVGVEETLMLPWFGAACDNATDDLAAAAGAVSLAQALQGLVSVSLFKPTLTLCVPIGKVLYLSGTLDLGANVGLVGQVRTGASGIGIICGSYGATSANQRYVIDIERASESDWSDMSETPGNPASIATAAGAATRIGLEFRNQTGCVEWRCSAARFTVGIKLHANATQIAYLKGMSIGMLWNNKVGLLLWNAASGWCNELSTFGGRWGCSSTKELSKSRYGIVAGGDGSYPTYNNLWFDYPSFEIASSKLGGGTIPIWFSAFSYGADAEVCAGQNIYRTAAGGTSGTTMPTHTAGSVSDGGVTWAFVREVVPFIFDGGLYIEARNVRAENQACDVAAHISAATRYMKLTAGWGSGRIRGGGVVAGLDGDELVAAALLNPWHSGSLANLAVESSVLYSNGKFHCVSASGNKLRTSWAGVASVTSDKDGLWLLGSVGVGVFVDARMHKKFAVLHDSGSSAVADLVRVTIVPRDAMGVVLPAASHVFGASKAVGSSSTSFVNTTAFATGSGASQGIDRSIPIVFTVSDQVAFFEVIFSRGTDNGLLRTFSVAAFGGGQPTVWMEVHEFDPNMVGAALAEPTGGLFIKGQRVVSNNPSAGAGGWMVSASGEFGASLGSPTGDITNGSPIVTNVSSLAGITRGGILTIGAGLPRRRVDAILSANSLLMSANSTATATGAAISRPAPTFVAV